MEPVVLCKNINKVGALALVSMSSFCSALYGYKNIRCIPRYAPYIMFSFVTCLLLQSLAVTAHELVNATCCIDKLSLTSVEWVRCVRNLKLYQWVSLALELDSLLSVAS